MPLAMELFFDQRTETAIRSLWAAIAAEGICEHMNLSRSRPHVSLSVIEDMKEAELRRILGRFVSAHGRIPLSLSAQGRFPNTGIAFLAPKPSIKLLSMQQWLHTELVRAGAVVWPAYLPSAWVPHCTLTKEAAAGSSERLARLIDAQELPATVHLESVGLVRFQPVTHLQDFPLSA